MCGRYYVPAPEDAPDVLAKILDTLEKRLQAKQPDFRLKRGEICPGDFAAVLAPGRMDRKPAPFLMKWGFSLDKRLVFNARSESAADKPMFRQSLQERRCLIPATAYFEWDHHAQRAPKYRFEPERQEMFYMAGLYRFEPGQPLPVFTILTRPAADSLSVVHDRMPVILPHRLCDKWLDSAADPERLLSQAVEEFHFSPA